jgi:hypothetical protein
MKEGGLKVIKMYRTRWDNKFVRIVFESNYYIIGGLKGFPIDYI